MSNIAQNYVTFLGDLWNNIEDWFQNHIAIIVEVFYGDWAGAGGYFQKLGASIGSLKALDYIAFILVLIIDLAFMFLLIVLLVQLVRRYIKFNEREIDKDSLIEDKPKGC
jgi:hypothetical protein